MSISITCECGRQFRTPEVNAGRRARCPSCEREFTVPTPVPQTVPEPAEVRFIPEEPVPTSISGKAIASLAFGLLFFFACLSGLPAILLGRRALRDINRGGGRLRGRGMAIAGIVRGVIGCLFTLTLFLPAIRSSREAARRSQCIGNLTQIGVAFHNYHSVYDCLPPAAITDKNGKPLLSWRVAILPFVESNTLYSKFHLDEPWDSPHNLSLLDPMPRTYACPSDSTLKPGMTNYLVVIGRETAFVPDFTPLRFQDFTDGMSNTLLVGESRHGVPWTKPEDLPFDLGIPLSGLGSHHGYHNNGFNGLFVDVHVLFLKSSITAKTLRALLTRGANGDDSTEQF